MILCVRRFPLAILLVALLPSAMHGSDRDAMLVSPEWMAEHLEDPGLVILHVGSKSDYEAGHIPGSLQISLSDISASHGSLTLELPAPDLLAERLGRLGISEKSRIVIYNGSDPLQSATRLWFTLDYVRNSQHASILDGGLALWRRQGRPVTTEVSAVPENSGQTRISTNVDTIVTHRDITMNFEDKEGFVILDARLPEFYSGQQSGRMPRAGRIPGAKSLPFSTLIDDEGRLLPEHQLRSLLEPLVAGAKDIVIYCHIGQQATLVYFAARSVGLKPRLYDGSFQEWSNNPELPVER
jgi:thiosulfate/3-mercaptopyruvate sulfurtransferase